MEMSYTDIFHAFLIGCMLILGILILVAILRSVRGPKTADRVIAVNMIGTMTMVIIAMLTIYLKEDYLADVCLVYAMVSFLAVVVLTKIYTGIYLQKKGIKEEKAAIEDNLNHQKKTEEEN
jgi:multicomponent Na+:H+ antiporter subunit F